MALHTHGVKSPQASFAKRGNSVSGQPGLMNKTNTGSAGVSAGLQSSLGMSGPVMSMGGPKRK